MLRLASIEQDGDDGKAAFRVGVDEVGNQVITAHVHLLFAAMMKVKLLEGVSFIGNRESAARCIVNLKPVSTIVTRRCQRNGICQRKNAGAKRKD